MKKALYLLFTILIMSCSSTQKTTENELPEGVELVSVLNQADMVHARVGDFFMNFFQGILLVGLFIFIAV